MLLDTSIFSCLVARVLTGACAVFPPVYSNQIQLERYVQEILSAHLFLDFGFPGYKDTS